MVAACGETAAGAMGFAPGGETSTRTALHLWLPGMPTPMLMLPPATLPPWSELPAAGPLGPLLGFTLITGAAVIAVAWWWRFRLTRHAGELKASEERFRELFEHAIEGVYETRPDGGFRTANPAMARLLGFDSPAELIGAHTDVTQQAIFHP